ncbi:MAG: outer membrane protein assembly factor BamD [Gemmatimonadetes bacterium]|nr:outer membrane protein assembly factor BamD [Gemmatimonadota bacterium]
MKRSIVVGVVLVASACTRQGFRVKDYVTPETLMEASRQEFRKGHFSAARTGFQRVTFEVPTTDPLGGEARYYLAECEYAQGEFIEAARDFRKVADDYENHPLAADALLRAGDAAVAQWNRVELDPTAGEEAVASYQELATRYPSSRAAERAKLQLQALGNRFAEKEYRAGVFYFRLKAYDSAIIYFRAVAADYGESTYAPQALIMLVESYRRIKYQEEITETCAHLRQYYPRAPGLNQACPAADSTAS